MTTIFLRFPDKQAFYATLPAEAFACPACEAAPGAPCEVCHGTGALADIPGETFLPLPAGVAAVSIVGPMYAPGVYDPATSLTSPTPLPGFHVNALGDVPPSWAAFQIFPANPARVFGAA